MINSAKMAWMFIGPPLGQLILLATMIWLIWTFRKRKILTSNGVF
ncbi:MAG: hypothetical protein P1V20_30605 [Verrucomicrobiales bacterium]|nr:hypothetical protein [Verrucomicrobiales bacterium]